ncbi:hypothetical protein N7490_008267 [Penicillium lividum]|nr:hypothetical protein N7490_008267 [Penicillium lividum]
MFEHDAPRFLDISDHTGTMISYISSGVLLIIILLWIRPSRNKAPIANTKKWYEWTWNRAATEFAFRSKELLAAAAAVSKGKPFQVATTQGFMTVLGSKYITETRNDDRFDFGDHIHVAFNGSVPGFDGFDQRNGGSWILVQIAQKHLTAYLNQMTVPLSEECDRTLKEYLANSPEWHTISANHEVARIISKMSSRIFLGEEFCRDERWIEASSGYATNLFSAQERLSLWPSYLRSVVHWFLPYCKELRRNVTICRNIIEETLAAREARRAAQEKQGVVPDQVDDTLEWMQKVSNGKSFDPTKVQLALSMAAIHTTTDLTVWLLMCLAQRPEVIQRMREEIISVMKVDGWKKTSLYNLKLMDSVMKESQRLKPNVLATMRRLVKQDITLSDGEFLPRGTMTLVLSQQMRDPSLYPNPDEFQPDRFLKMRQIPGKENQAQFVTTSPQHMGFSHGRHACPGRFFAGTETKILLCHLLLKYDFRLTDQSPSDSVAFGFALIPNPGVKLDIRRRKEELDLSKI